MRFLKLLPLLATLISPAVRGQSFWTAPSSEFDFSVEDVHAVSDDIVMAATVSGTWISVDGGSSWTQSRVETTNGVTSTDLGNGAYRLFSASRSGLYVSTNLGQNWSVLMASKAESVSVVGNHLLVGGAGGQLFYSPDAGSSWTTINCDILPLGFDDEVTVSALAGINSAEPSAVAYQIGFGNGIFTRVSSAWGPLGSRPIDDVQYDEATDGLIAVEEQEIVISSDGATWSNLTTVTGIASFVTIDGMDRLQNRIVAFDASGLFLISEDRGANWTSWQTGLAAGAGSLVRSTSISPGGYVYVAVGKRVQRSVDPLQNLPVIAVDPPEEPQEVLALVAEVYPNPSTDRVHIDFESNRQTPVRVDVYDMLGRRVETLLDASSTRGIQKLRWEPRLAAGTYLIRITAGDDILERTVSIAK